jgi:D-arabinose 1-dehydrogenase-like Zn-dependent alcohol dehydrogenase
MKGYRLYAWGNDLVFEDIPDPTPGPEEVLIEVEACGVGLTVLNAMRGDLDNNPDLLPRVPGHELVGRVIEEASGGTPDLTGRRVVAYFYLSCGHCQWCSAGWEQRCVNLAGWVGVHRDGGYAPLVVLPAQNAIEVSDDIDPVDATVIPDAVATPVHVVRRAEIGPGDRVAIVGAGGGVGIHMVQVGLLKGATVAGLDVSDEKLGLVERFGASPVDSTDISRLKADQVFGDGAPTVVVDFVGNADTMRWSIDVLGPGGRLVQLTTFRDRVASFTSREMVFRELSIVGSRYATKADVQEAADLVGRGDVEAVIGKTVAPSGLPGLHQELKANRLLGRGALDWRRP